MKPTKQIVMSVLVFALVITGPPQLQGAPVQLAGTAQSCLDITQRLLRPPSHAQLTYKTRLVLEPTGNFEASASHLLDLFYQWTKERFPELKDLNRENFASGTVQNFNGTDIVIKRHSDDENANINYWVMALEKSIANRKWRTDAAITSDRAKNRLTFHTRVSTWSTSSAFIDPVVYTVPGIARLVTDDKGHWQVTTGDLVIPTGAALSLGSSNEDIDAFKQILTQAGQRLPIVFVSLNPRTNSYSIEPDVLSHALVGLAVVIKEAGIDTHRRLRQELPETHRAWQGAIRIYLPQVKFYDPSDSARHRYYKSEVVQGMGANFIEQISRALLIWQEQSGNTTEVVTFSDLVNLEMQQTAVKLRAQYENLAHNDETQVYRSLLEILEVEQKDLKNQIAHLQQDNEATLSAWQGAVQELENIRSLQDHLGKNLASRQGQIEKDESPTFPSQIPKSLPDLVKIFDESFKGRLFFTPKAYSSAEDSQFENLGIAWRMLYQMGTTLHRMYFEEGLNPNAIPQEFKNRTGFELGANESTSTAQTPRLRQLREDLYNGKTVYMAAHVKYGNRAPKLLRVHFYVDRENQLIVIGHVGDHLENLASRHQ